MNYKYVLIWSVLIASIIHAYEPEYHPHYAGTQSSIINQTNNQVYEELFVRLDIVTIEETFDLSSRKLKKINKIYKRYVDSQLKAKEKLLKYDVRLKRMMQKRYIDDIDMKDLVYKWYEKKAQMKANSLLMLKHIESILPKNNIEKFRSMYVHEFSF